MMEGGRNGMWMNESKDEQMGGGRKKGKQEKKQKEGEKEGRADRQKERRIDRQMERDECEMNISKDNMDGVEEWRKSIDD